MAGNRVDQVSLPGVLQNHERRLRVLEAVAAGSGWMFDTDPQAGDWGVLSVSAKDPTEFTSTPISGYYYFRIDASVGDANSGILFVTIGTGDFAGLDSFLNLAAGSANLYGSQAVTIGGPETDINTIAILLPNIPASPAGLVANQVYRDGVGPDSALMVV